MAPGNARARVAWSRRANSDDKLLSGRLWILEPANRSSRMNEWHAGHVGVGHAGEGIDKDAGANGDANDLDSKSHVSLLSRTSLDREYLITHGERMQPTPESSVSMFDELSHVHVWHRQGLKAPPLVFKVCRDKEGRRFYMLLLPQVNAEQQEHCLCCRRKAKGNKFRFSVDQSKMTKKNNPNYIGKMKEQRRGLYEVHLRTHMLIMTIKISDNEVSAELQNQFLNSVELGRQGRTIRGNVQTFVQPMLALKVESSKRTILKVSRPFEIKEVSQPRTSSDINQIDTYLVDFDYPMTIFLSFAVLCAMIDSNLDAGNSKG